MHFTGIYSPFLLLLMKEWVWLGLNCNFHLNYLLSFYSEYIAYIGLSDGGEYHAINIFKFANLIYDSAANWRGVEKNGKIIYCIDIKFKFSLRLNSDFFFNSRRNINFWSAGVKKKALSYIHGRWIQAQDLYSDECQVNRWPTMYKLIIFI